MASGEDVRYRLWRDRLVQALAAYLPAELDEAEEIARLVFLHGLPPGINEVAVRATLRASAGATAEWVERVLQVVIAVRDGIRLVEPEPEPMRGAQPPIHLSETSEGVQPKSPPPDDSSYVPELFTPKRGQQRIPADAPDADLVLTQVLERLRALQEVRHLAPQVEGAHRSLRALRVAVAGEADDSVRLPLLLEEWLATRRRWEAHHQVFHGALSTVRSSEWLLHYLKAPDYHQD